MTAATWPVLTRRQSQAAPGGSCSLGQHRYHRLRPCCI